MHRILPLALAGLPAFLAPALHEPAITEFKIQADDFSFSAPDSIPAGLVRVTLINNGKEAHHAQIVRMNDTIPLAKFKTALEKAISDVKTQGEAAYMQLFAVATVAGGPGSVSPGKTSEATIELSSGQYMLLCFISSPDGHSHVAKGMARAFRVGGRAPATLEAPMASGTVNLTDFAFSALPAMKPGKTTLEITNAGPEPHELVVMRPKGISASQLIAMLSQPMPAPGGAAAPGAAGPAAKPPAGPPPFEAVGGMQALMPGKKGWTTLDLTAGEYVAVCMIPSPANQGKPHTALGMAKAFTVK